MFINTQWVVHLKLQCYATRLLSNAYFVYILSTLWFDVGPYVTVSIDSRISYQKCVTLTSTVTVQSLKPNKHNLDSLIAHGYRYQTISAHNSFHHEPLLTKYLDSWGHFQEYFSHDDHASHTGESNKAQSLWISWFHEY